MARLVALDLPPGPQLVEELRRAWDDGDAVLVVDSRLAGPARERLLRAMQPASVVGSDGERHDRAGAPPLVDGDALVVPTSGSTGEPKGAVLTHGAVRASALATSARLGVDPGRDRWWACLPLAHVGGLSVVTRSVVTGVDCEVGGAFGVEEARAALERGATLTSLVATALFRLGPDLSGQFRRIVLGGAAPPADLAENVVTTYGMTETGSGVVYDGVPLDGVEVRVDAGEVLLRGPMLLRSYRDGRDPKDPAGWLRTGDGGELGPDGRLVVHGRLAEVIVSGGEKIWPAALEPVLTAHPAVRDVAVAGRADAEWGERVVAYVVLAAPLSPGRLLAELRELVSSELAAYCAPREVVLVGSIGRTALGKVRRGELSYVEGPSAAL